MLTVGMKAPNFIAVCNDTNELKKYISLTDIIDGKWCLMLFHPMDFGFSSPSLLLELNSMKGQLDNLNCNIIGCSSDKPMSVPQKEGGIAGMDIPVIEDENGHIAEKFGIMTKDSKYITRGFVLIDNYGFIRAQVYKDLVTDLKIKDIPDKIKRIRVAMKQIK